MPPLPGRVPREGHMGVRVCQHTNAGGSRLKGVCVVAARAHQGAATLSLVNPSLALSWVCACSSLLIIIIPQSTQLRNTTLARILHVPMAR